MFTYNRNLLHTPLNNVAPDLPQGIYWSSRLGLISLSATGGEGITISDKNLGATQVYNYGDELTQANCGNFYQWGNNYGFPYRVDGYGDYYPDSLITYSKINLSGYGPGNYFSRNKAFNIDANGYDEEQQNVNYPAYSRSWFLGTTATNLWGGDSQSLNDKTGPCLSGYHIPTFAELQYLVDFINSLGASWRDFTTILKAPGTGWRSYVNKSIIKLGQDNNGSNRWCCEAGKIGTDGMFYDDDLIDPENKDILFACGMGWNVDTSIGTLYIGKDYYNCDLFNIRPFYNFIIEPDNTREKLL